MAIYVLLLQPCNLHVIVFFSTALLFMSDKEVFTLYLVLHLSVLQKVIQSPILNF